MNIKLPEGLAILIDQVSRIPDMDSIVLNKLISDMSLSARELEPFAGFDHLPSLSYGRKPLYNDGRLKIWLMSWCPGDFTAIHNHRPNQWGCVLFFGETTHRLYKIDGQELKLEQAGLVPSGYIARVTGELTHMMGNGGTENFNTLHIYGSNDDYLDRRENALVYQPEHKKVVETTGEAFLNTSQELILAETGFDQVDRETLRDYLKLIKPYYLRNQQQEMVANIEAYLENPELS